MLPLGEKAMTFTAMPDVYFSGLKKVEELMASDQTFAEDVELLRRTLSG